MPSPSDVAADRPGELLLGLDMGTGSSKAVLATPEGEIVATAVRPRTDSVSVPRPGWAEVDADVSPDRGRQPVYDDLYRDYVDLYPATKTIVHDLAGLQEEAGR
jgi:hypothetical protein